MPTGSATYAGRASVTTTLESGALRTTNADLALSANFTARTLSVGLTNFVTGSTVYTGSATGAGSISGNSFSAQYSGVLAAPTQSEVPIGGSMTGVFRGTNAAALNGAISITGGAATGGDAFGQFYANKN